MSLGQQRKSLTLRNFPVNDTDAFLILVLCEYNIGMIWDFNVNSTQRYLCHLPLYRSSELKEAISLRLLKLVTELVREGELTLAKIMRRKVLEKCDPNQRPIRNCRL